MATKQDTVDYILDQLLSLQNVKARKMFGEYALYCEGKVVALICNDRLYVKITEQGKKFIADYYCEGHAYKGARVSMIIDEDKIDDSEWLCELISVTAANLPVPKKVIRKKYE
jgi:DNA transformation protein